MSDAFWGVLAGGLIGISGTIATLVIQHKQWKTNRRIEYLQNKKEKYVKIFDTFSQKAENPAGISRTQLWSEFALRIPSVVERELREVMDTIDDGQSPTLTLIEIMGIYLEDIDKEIDNLTK